MGELGAHKCFPPPFSITGVQHTQPGAGVLSRCRASASSPFLGKPTLGVLPCSRAKPGQTEPDTGTSGGLCHLSCHWQVSRGPEENEHDLNPGSGLVCMGAQLSCKQPALGCDSSARSSSSAGTPRGARAPQPGHLSASQHTP